MYILIGLISAFFQSSAFVFSRRFVVEHKSPLKLLVYTSLEMGILGLITFLAILPRLDFRFTGSLGLWLVVFIFSSCGGAFCFFRALQDIEASRLSSLMGLKLIVLIPVNMLFFHTLPGLFQYLSIVLGVIAAVGMNFTGGPIKLKGFLFLLMTLVFYSFSDVTASKITMETGSDSLLLNSLAGTGLAFAANMIPMSLCFLRIGFEKQCLLSALPYSLFWYTAMIMLFATFVELGVLLGAIIQASRGFISVLLGVTLNKIGFDKLEPGVSAAAWIRRVVMAILMIGAIALYTIR